jgi:hypothetical protein
MPEILDSRTEKGLLNVPVLKIGYLWWHVDSIYIKKTVGKIDNRSSKLEFRGSLQGGLPADDCNAGSTEIKNILPSSS